MSHVHVCAASRSLAAYYKHCIIDAMQVVALWIGLLACLCSQSVSQSAAVV